MSLHFPSYILQTLESSKLLLQDITVPINEDSVNYMICSSWKILFSFSLIYLVTFREFWVNQWLSIEFQGNNPYLLTSCSEWFTIIYFLDQSDPSIKPCSMALIKFRRLLKKLLKKYTLKPLSFFFFNWTFYESTSTYIWSINITFSWKQIMIWALKSFR